MFRENEASRVSDVLARKQAGDIKGLLEAATRAWLEPPERDDDTVDAEIWSALEQAGAFHQAVATGQHLIREGKLLRPGTYIRIIEQTPPAGLLQLATLALDAGWAAQPYLGAIFAAAIDAKLEPAVWDFIRAHRDRLAAPLETWLLVAFVLTTSRIGDRRDVANWFENRPANERVPMWIVGAYAATVIQLYPKLSNVPFPLLLSIARGAREQTIPDSSEPYFVAIMLMDLLRSAKYDEFRAEMAKHRATLEAQPNVPPVEHPLVEYANRARRARRVTAQDFAYRVEGGAAFFAITLPGMIVLAAEGAKGRPPNWQIAQPVLELQAMCGIAARVLGLFDDMLPLQKGDRAAVELGFKMTRSYPSSAPWIRDAWQRIVRQRVGWWSRLRLAWG